MSINLKKYWAVILILLTIVGFVSKALYNYPLTIMAIIGFYRVIVSPQSIWSEQTLKYFIFLFLCLWIPMLLAFPDAVNPSRSAQTVFPYLRFLFAGIFIIHELSKNYESIFNKRAKLFSEKKLKNMILTELEYKNYILENYTFLKRPVIITGNKIFIGNSKKNVLELKKHLGE